MTAVPRGRDRQDGRSRSRARACKRWTFASSGATVDLPRRRAGFRPVDRAIAGSPSRPVGLDCLHVGLRRQKHALKRGLPLRRDARLVPWSDVTLIDHAAQTVRLAVSGRLAIAPRLARSKGTHGGGAEAVRVAGLLGVGASGTDDSHGSDRRSLPRCPRPRRARILDAARGVPARERPAPAGARIRTLRSACGPLPWRVGERPQPLGSKAGGWLAGRGQGSSRTVTMSSTSTAA